jgi:hypothetical protein
MAALTHALGQNDGTFALCFMPPSDIAATLNCIREKHDKAFNTWPAHIRIMYLDSTMATNAAFQSCFTDHCSEIEPFYLTLRSPSRLAGAEKTKDGRKYIASRVDAFMKTGEEPRSPVDFLELEGHSSPILHCTVAQKPNLKAVDDFVSTLDWWDDHQMTWRVEAVTLLQKRNGRFVPVREFRIGSRDLSREGHRRGGWGWTGAGAGAGAGAGMHTGR